MTSDLPDRLLQHAVEITRESGLQDLSVREVQRRSSVSPAAAYRHFRNREALLLAVGRYAAARLADRIQQAVDAAPGTIGPGPRPDDSRAVLQLRAGITAYIDFAREEPELFRAVTRTGEEPVRINDPDPAARGRAGRGPYEILTGLLDDLVAHGDLAVAGRVWSDVAVWAASHGIATLLLDSPLRLLPAADQDAAVARLVELLVSGLTSPGGGPTRT